MDRNPLIDDFVARYAHEYDYYLESARIISVYCENVLRENGLQAIVSYRAKSPERLEKKLYSRIASKNYQSAKDITADIVDLSGVRIALYFPNDRLIIRKVFERQLELDKIVEFPGLKKRTVLQRFDGYQAEHYRMTVTEKVTSKSQSRYNGVKVEIQVASVLMHAWSEVEHDIVYKSLNGKASSEEIKILDGLNGLVHTGEVFLERLQEAYLNRVAIEKKLILTIESLRDFLCNMARSQDVAIDCSALLIGELDTLLRLIIALGINDYEKLREYTSELQLRTNMYSISDQVIEQIVSNKKDNYAVYKEAFAGEGISVSNMQGKPKNINVEFIKAWTALERFSYELQTGLNLRSDRVLNLGINAPIQYLTTYNRIPASYVHRIKFLQNIQISYIDNFSTVSDNMLFNAFAYLSGIIYDFINHDDEVISDAFKRVYEKYPELR